MTHDADNRPVNMAAAAAASLPPWCGAPRHLGGQQPCPIKVPCAGEECVIADNAPEPEPWHPYEQSDPAVNGCDHCGDDRRWHP